MVEAIIPRSANPGHGRSAAAGANADARQQTQEDAERLNQNITDIVSLTQTMPRAGGRAVYRQDETSLDEESRVPPAQPSQYESEA